MYTWNYGRDYLHKKSSRIEHRQLDLEVPIFFISVLSPNGRGHISISRFFQMLHNFGRSLKFQRHFSLALCCYNWRWIKTETVVWTINYSSWANLETIFFCSRLPPFCSFLPHKHKRDNLYNVVWKSSYILFFLDWRPCHTKPHKAGPCTISCGMWQKSLRIWAGFLLTILHFGIFPRNISVYTVKCVCITKYVVERK